LRQPNLSTPLSLSAEPWARRARRSTASPIATALALMLAAATPLASGGCSSASGHPSVFNHTSEGTTRYRLLLRENPVDPGEAFRCYGKCQAAPSPSQYLECLGTCPGFDVTPDEYCANTEVPPVAACLTVRKVPRASEPDPGLVVLAVVGTFALVVAATSLCASSQSQCGYDYRNYPPPH
jgi:hypothetical protein